MHHPEITHEMARLALQLGTLLLAAHLLGRLARKANLTSLIGEIAAGMLLGPFALGAVPLPAFSDGLFPVADPAFPVSELLFGFATVGAIVHIFMAGLESDPGFLARIRTRGILVAILSAVGGLVAGGIAARSVFGVSPLQPAGLLIMAISVSTSIGVQARVLAGQHRLSSPEGSVILGSSIFHDGFAIILLTVAVGLTGSGSVLSDPSASTEAAGLIPSIVSGFENAHWLTVPLGIALATWMIAYALLLSTARSATRMARRVFSANGLAIMSLGVALVVSGIFEAVGVAAVAGAYGVGLALSRTEHSSLFEQRMRSLSEFFIPILYAVLGMFIDIRIIFSPSILIPGLSFAVISGAAKTIGGMIPARLGGFTWFGSTLTGLATVSRGEIGIIVTGIGVGAGILTLDTLKILTVMIIVSTLVVTPLLRHILASKRPRTSAREGLMQTVVRSMSFPTEEIAELVIGSVLRAMEKDGFFISRMEIDGSVYSLRDPTRAFTLQQKHTEIQLSGSSSDSEFLNTILYEAIIHVNERIRTLTTIEVPSELRRAAGFTHSGPETEATGVAATSQQPARAPGTVKSRPLDIGQYFDPCSIALSTNARTSEELIGELVGRLSACGTIIDTDTALEDVLARERSLGTGLEHGVALPHARSSGVEQTTVAVAISPEGIDFQAADGTPSRIIVLVVSPRERTGPHLQLIAALVGRLRNPVVRTAILSSESPEAVIEALR